MDNVDMVERQEPFINLITRFRDKECSGENLKEVYRSLGSIFAYKLAQYIDFDPYKIITPMEKEYNGSKNEVNNDCLFVSTFEDNASFTKVIGDFYGVKDYAKLEVYRAENGWNASITKVSVPEKIKSVKKIIFCKSVLATGCTAKSILKYMCEQYNPEEIIIIAIISSDEAIQELNDEYRYLKISFLIGETDSLDHEKGMLVPGVGLLEKRLKNFDN